MTPETLTALIQVDISLRLRSQALTLRKGRRDSTFHISLYHQGPLPIRVFFISLENRRDAEIPRTCKNFANEEIQNGHLRLVRLKTSKQASSS
jgi:hypothetical protein